MPNFRKRDLVGEPTTSPPLAPLLGGQPPKRDRILSVFGQVDRFYGNSRRIVARVGLAGSNQFHVGNFNPTSGGVQVYPTKTARRVAARSQFALSPGCFLRFSCIVAPSGMTQRMTGINWVADKPMGEIIVRATFDGMSSSTVEFTRSLHVSSEVWAAEDTDDGATWSGLKRYDIPLIYPADAKDNIFNMWRYSEGVTCNLEVIYRGGVRCVDAFVSELPFAYVRDVGTDLESDFSMVLATDNVGDHVKNYPAPFPIEEKSSTDPCFGSLLLADVAHKQHKSLGPVLATFTSWNETTQGVTATEAAALTTSSTTFVNLVSTSLSTWAESNPGWSIASGGQAQQFASSNALRELRDKDAVVPVRIWVYGARSVSGTASLRFQTRDYSVAEMTISSATEAWYSSVIGHLRCGLNAEDASNLQVFGRVSTALSTLSVRAIVLEYIDA